MFFGEIMNITPSKLYRCKSQQLVRQELGSLISLGPDEVLWMYGSRRSSLGGYIGIFSRTYTQINGYSPTGYKFEIHLDNMENV